MRQRELYGGWKLHIYKNWQSVVVVLPFCKVLCRSTVEGCGAFVQMPHVCARQSSERHSGRCISSLLWVTPCRSAMERCAAPPIAGLLSLAPQQCSTCKGILVILTPFTVSAFMLPWIKKSEMTIFDAISHPNLILDRNRAK